MRTGNEARQVQVLSLKDEIHSLQAEIVSIKKERSEWRDKKQQREDELSALDTQTFAAKEAHKALCKSHDAEIEIKKTELERLVKSCSDLENWYSHQAAEKSIEMMGHEQTIKEKKETIDKLLFAEQELTRSVSRLSTDKVLSLKDTARALDDNRKAVQKLSDTSARIAQAEKDEKNGEASRKATVVALQEWQDRLTVREDDFNVLVERMKPEFIKIFGETKLNAHVFEPSRPK